MGLPLKRDVTTAVALLYQANWVTRCIAVFSLLMLFPSYRTITRACTSIATVVLCRQVFPSLCLGCLGLAMALVQLTNAWFFEAYRDRRVNALVIPDNLLPQRNEHERSTAVVNDSVGGSDRGARLTSRMVLSPVRPNRSPGQGDSSSIITVRVSESESSVGAHGVALLSSSDGLTGSPSRQASQSTWSASESGPSQVATAGHGDDQAVSVSGGDGAAGVSASGSVNADPGAGVASSSSRRGSAFRNDRGGPLWRSDVSSTSATNAQLPVARRVSSGMPLELE